MIRIGKRESLLALALAALSLAAVGYKHYGLGYTVPSLSPERGYQVDLKIDVEGSGRDVDVSLPLPMQTERQIVRREHQDSQTFRYAVDSKRLAQWKASGLAAADTIHYQFFAQTKARSYTFPDTPIAPPEDLATLSPYLESTDKIQGEDPDIETLAWELAPLGSAWQEGVRKIYEYAYRDIKFKAVRGSTDALTAMRSQSASCNGKNRLLVALLRARGIPARLCKGLILENTSKRTTHAWSEAFVQGQWIPLCPTNGYFAKIPENYLELAKGDQSLFRHSKYIGFDWRWTVEKKVSRIEDAVWASARNPLNVLNLWVSLQDFNISLNLIMVVLMIPIAASAVSFTRNIVGLVTFGTFMPALISVSFLETGFLSGSAVFIVIILSTSLINFALLKLRLLHIPRLVIILTVVVASVLASSVISTQLGIGSGAGISLFPIAILSLTSERFTQTVNEDGWREAFTRVAITFLVAAICFALISRTELQLLVVAYPELLLLNIAANLVIGSWHGLRLMELRRFRPILKA